MKKLFVCLSLVFVACMPATEQPAKPLLLISFDGFRADYLTKADTPNFDRLVEQGVSSDGLIPVFPTKTFPNHYAIVTGLYPEHNGLVGNNMYDPVMDARYSIGNREAVENPDWYEGEPIWNTVEKQGKKAGTMFWVGSEAPIQDMRPTYWKPYDGDMPEKARIDSVLKWMSYPEQEKRIDLGTLYFSFTDNAGHRYGPDAEEVAEAIERADELVGYLIDQMKTKNLWGEANILIVSDHGMINLSKERLLLIDDIIDLDDVDVISYSPVIGLNPLPGKTEEVYAALKENEEHYTVYRKEELPERYGLKNHRRTPKILVVADPGWTISDSGYTSGRPDYPSGGTHGFDNLDPRMHAIFIGVGPDFKQGYRTDAFENVHLYELMAHLLNVKPSVNDGNLDTLSEILE